ncbi:SRPBCC family protein [Allokutzneria sp. A3M-2-11 16]|uniref:SRPBCC family protein n=1 Tax=Allokutzneria sp. A3M-2-11 16 TaxID=2962043 RepID=UPI0020B69CC4|nr:SRPBCC family protein [Allokutzneria sp. A3M-2-11 16]MCP3803445.1 SRPBCC family protein [Allokutzneria sp. A3M-2-11 16]
MSPGAECRLVGALRVPLPPAEAFRLFTPRGEESWVPGWRPEFPVPTEDDTAPGTVFQTRADGRTTTWVVLARQPGHLLRYARLTPEVWAGTVEVELTPAGDGSEVKVAYELTALSEPARTELREFADRYPEFLATWSEAITEALTGVHR